MFINTNIEVLNKLLTILSNPYDNQENILRFQYPAPNSDQKYQTFCGT